MTIKIIHQGSSAWETMRAGTEIRIRDALKGSGFEFDDPRLVAKIESSVRWYSPRVEVFRSDTWESVGKSGPGVVC